MWDIVVIGAGPAGLSAAINGAARRKSVLVIGAQESSNKVMRAEKMDNYLGLPRITGKDMADAFLAHAQTFDITFMTAHVEQVYDMDSFFMLDLRGQDDMIEATTVVLATGVGVSRLLENEEKFLGRGLGYCATCDAALYKDKTVVVIGMNEESIEDTNFISEFASHTTFVNRTGRSVELKPGIEVVTDHPVGFEGTDKAEKLIMRKGELEADGFFIIRDAKNADQLVPGLVSEGAHVPVDKSMRTNIPGMYAVGDLTGAPYQVAKAVGEGQVAGLDAARYVTAVARTGQGTASC